jgi:hypothetical protein
MELYEPFTGVLLLPDRSPFGRTSPVLLGDGRPVATVRRQAWTARGRFDILDAAGATVAATGSAAGFWGRRYVLTLPGGAPLLELRLGWRGPAGRNTVALPDGRILVTTGTWTNRDFAVADQAGGPVARLVNTSRAFSWRPDNLAFEVQAPVLSLVQVIGLAQCIRAAVEAQRNSTAAAVTPVVS